VAPPAQEGRGWCSTPPASAHLGGIRAVLPEAGGHGHRGAHVCKLHKGLVPTRAAHCRPVTHCHPERAALKEGQGACGAAALGLRVTRARPVGPHMQPGLRERPERRAQLRELFLSRGVRQVSQVQHLAGGEAESESSGGRSCRHGLCRLAQAGTSRNKPAGRQVQTPLCTTVTQDQDGCRVCARGGGAGRAGVHTGGSSGRRVTSQCGGREGVGAGAACSCGAPLMALLRRVCLVPCLLLVRSQSSGEQEEEERKEGNGAAEQHASA
jgi:hypothetical protein